jgi:hypothetical protein
VFLALHQNFVIGGVQLRQVRVEGRPYEHKQNYNPSLVAPLDTGVSTQYKEWSTKEQDTEGWTGASNTTYPFKADHDELNGENYRYVRSYGKGGYSTLLRANDTEATNAAKIESMMGDGWIGPGTRAVSIKLNTYHPGRETVTTMTLVAEIGSTGLFTLSHELITFRVQPYRSVTHTQAPALPSPGGSTPPPPPPLSSHPARPTPPPV